MDWGAFRSCPKARWCGIKVMIEDILNDFVQKGGGGGGHPCTPTHTINQATVNPEDMHRVQTAH